MHRRFESNVGYFIVLRKRIDHFPWIKRTREQNRRKGCIKNRSFTNYSTLTSQNHHHVSFLFYVCFPYLKSAQKKKRWYKEFTYFLLETTFFFPPSLMLESLVASILNRFLGNYVSNLNYDQLNIGIWNGKNIFYIYIYIFFCVKILKSIYLHLFILYN